MKKRTANLKLVYPADKNPRETDDAKTAALNHRSVLRGRGHHGGIPRSAIPVPICQRLHAGGHRTFQQNHPGTWADCENVERVKPADIRAKLKIRKGELDVLVGGPPCQGFSINAPERFLTDPRNKLFKDYVRFLEGVRAQDISV